jgi:leader peptidase (prepilin peptidase)/N-methyltransferase
MDSIDLLASRPGLFAAVMAVLGLLVGSFLNVVIHRLPRMMEREWGAECRALLGLAPETGEPFDLVRPRSRCPHCAAPITALQNIPLVSYALLRGRCGACRARIPLRYPVVEVLAGLAGGYAAWHFGTAAGAASPGWLVQAAAAAACIWTLLALAAIDLDTRLLPDSITLPLLWAGLGCAFFGLFAPTLEAAVLGAMLGYLSLWSIYWLFKLLTGKEGMGYGDFKLLAALGAWLGWQALPALILLSSAVGAVTGLTLMATGAVGRRQPIPFGPFLAAAGVIALLWGEALPGLFGSGLL